MKITRLILFELFCCLIFNSQAQEFKTSHAKLKEATVFFRGAELTHETSVNLQKGNNELTITDLSPMLDVNSLKIKTSTGALVSSFEFSTDYLSNEK